MAISEEDIERNRVRGQYTWSYLLSYGDFCAVRSLISGEALSDKHGIPNGGFLSSLSSIPPVGPPISVL